MENTWCITNIYLLQNLSFCFSIYQTRRKRYVYLHNVDSRLNEDNKFHYSFRVVAIETVTNQEATINSRNRLINFKINQYFVWPTFGPTTVAITPWMFTNNLFMKSFGIFRHAVWGTSKSSSSLLTSCLRRLGPDNPYMFNKLRVQCSR